MNQATGFTPQRLSAARILVVGDVMLDRYWFGDVARISPEAPVPIVKIHRQEERLGGAANVARNTAALGVATALLSIVGTDEAGGAVQRLLEQAGIDAHLHEDAALDTIIKLRVIGRQQQLLRIDFEAPPSDHVLTDKLAQFHSLLPAYDLVVLSDYGKGSLTHIEAMIAAANDLRIPVLVDPKGDDYARYRHASVLTPNLAEFRAVAGNWKTEAEFCDKAEALRVGLNLQALLITRSEAGMTLFSETGMLHQPTVAREVFDVSGAGDTVIATLGAMMAIGENLETAVSWANRAAGIVVAKLGTAVALPEELFAGAVNV
ncbi:MAG: D-glycero-beta-D-manno-heptose-7-phosphate kinase [Burkholderiales bacterium]